MSSNYQERIDAFKAKHSLTGSAHDPTRFNSDGTLRLKDGSVEAYNKAVVKYSGNKPRGWKPVQNTAKTHLVTGYHRRDGTEWVKSHNRNDPKKGQ